MDQQTQQTTAETTATVETAKSTQGYSNWKKFGLLSLGAGAGAVLGSIITTAIGVHVSKNHTLVPNPAPVQTQVQVQPQPAPQPTEEA